LPLIFLVAVVAGWLQIVAADADARRGFFNGLLVRKEMGDIRLYCLVLLVLSGKTRQLLGRFREFDEHLVADDAHRILLQFCVLGFNPMALS